MKGSLTILSTKPLDPRASDFARERGWELKECPFIEVRPLAGAPIAELRQRLGERREGDLLVFTSPHAVTHGARAWRAWPVACLSGKTLEAVRADFPPAKVVATGPSASALASLILELPGTRCVVFPCAFKSRPELPEALESAGIRVQRYPVYETIGAPSSVAGPFDGILFFSPSGVEAFFEGNPVAPQGTCFAIGNTTAEAVRLHTGGPVVVSPEPRQDALLMAVQQYFYGKE